MMAKKNEQVSEKLSPGFYIGYGMHKHQSEMDVELRSIKLRI